MMTAHDPRPALSSIAKLADSACSIGTKRAVRRHALFEIRRLALETLHAMKEPLPPPLTCALCSRPGANETWRGKPCHTECRKNEQALTLPEKP